MPLTATITEAGASLLDLIYPPKCLVCGAPGPVDLCHECRAQFVPIEEPFCRHCGALVSPGVKLCAVCESQTSPNVASAWAAGSFEGTLRDAILRLKYGQKRRLAPPLGDFLAEFLARQEDFPRRADAIVPVPLHPSRLRERGFNQSELLALRIVPGLEMPIRTDWLRRIRRTRPQVELDADQRAANVRDAFAVPNGVDLDGTTIILLDDVLTTGHTVQECARALANSGAKAVHVVAVARGAV